MNSAQVAATSSGAAELRDDGGHEAPLDSSVRLAIASRFRRPAKRTKAPQISGIDHAHTMRLKHRRGVIKNSANGAVRFLCSLVGQRSQDSGDIGDGDRGDVARMQRSEMSSQRAFANPVRPDVLVRACGVGEPAVDRLAERERARGLSEPLTAFGAYAGQSSLQRRRDGRPGPADELGRGRRRDRSQGQTCAGVRRS